MQDGRARSSAVTWLLVVLATACRGDEPGRVVQVPAQVAAQPALPVDRIAIVGASVSAGFGGMPFGDAFARAAPRSRIDAPANVMLFQDPVGESRLQIDRAIAFRATTVVALDFLFWDLYGSPDPRWREHALTAGLGELERARKSGAWILVGDIPLVTTASELLLPRANVPDPEALAAANATIAAWAKRERVLHVPFASWAEPLAQQGDIELAPGERVPARTLVAADGLHANELGVWTLLDRLDRLIETALPGTPRNALVFVRPTRRAE